MATQSKEAVLKFWRDVEIFNIPTALKAEIKRNHERKMTFRVTQYRNGDTLPWQPNHTPQFTSTERDEWIHAVFIGVTKTSFWAEIVLQAISPHHALQDSELEQLRGKGWIAAFIVNEQGLAIGDSYVPASFTLGIQRLRQGLTLDGLNDDIRARCTEFKDRQPSSAAADSDVTPNHPPKDASPPHDSPTSENPTSQSPCIGWNILDAELQHALQPLGNYITPSNFSVVIKSTLRKRRKKVDADTSKTEVDVDFLNSFFLDDLDRLIAETGANQHFGRALAQYLGDASSPRDRQDILTQPRAMADCLSPKKFTSGRWPSSSNHHLMLAQQAAVAEIMQLQPTAGLVAVNGPPGTGKSTLLRDVVADVVVRRAHALAKLKVPWDAFDKAIIGGRTVFPLKAKIMDGTSIVVTSNNNAAVENISQELPSLKEIAANEFHGAAYLSEVAANLFEAAKIQTPAWGLVAATLGNNENRRKFANAFFQKQKKAQPTYAPNQPCDIKTLLDAQHHNGYENWKTAKADFLDLSEQVTRWRNRFTEVEHAVSQQNELLDLINELGQQAKTLKHQQSTSRTQWANETQLAKATLTNAQVALSQSQQNELQAKLFAQAATDRLQAAEAEKSPRIWDRWLKEIGIRTRRMHDWENAMRVSQLNRAQATDNWRTAIEQRSSNEKAISRFDRELADLTARQKNQTASLRRKIATLERKIEDANTQLQQHNQIIAAFRETGGIIPDDAFFKRPTAERHLASVWVSPAFDALRAKLFLAALRLHETTLLACHGKAIANFRTVKEMLTKNLPEPIASADQHKQLWDMLFFAVPVISSTLASFSRLFSGLEREALGWLLIDEAGQATPQSIAGALWRSKRVVVIGDPLQVEPIVTVPAAVIATVRSKHAIDVSWSPITESAQTLADRTMVLGAYIGDPHATQATWTGLPLRAHRRCIDPMFSVANAIAYDNQMVQATTRVPSMDCILGESAWLDVQSQSSSGQIVGQEMQCLVGILRQLKINWPVHNGNKPSGLYIISPFRRVAEACWDKLHRANIYQKTHPVDCGTVHRFQGKQSEIVFIVLGSAPGKAGSGSRAWAASKPNLLNVALTRAKFRVYVIGNVSDWEQCSYFDPLVTEFRKRERILDASVTLAALQSQNSGIHDTADLFENYSRLPADMASPSENIVRPHKNMSVANS